MPSLDFGGMTQQADEIGVAAYGDTLAEVFDEYIAQDDTAETVAFLDGLLPPTGDAYEMGLGTGRIALELSGRGHRVTGHEVSGAMIDVLRTKPGSASITVLPGDFVTGRPPAGEFDVVYCVDVTFNALGTRERQLEFFARSVALIRGTGSLVIESLLPSPNRRVTGPESQVSTSDKGVLNAVSFTHDALEQTLTGESTFVLPGGGRYDHPFVTRYCSASELMLMAQLVGLAECAAYGDWHRAPLRAGAPSGVFVFRRS